MSSYAKGSGEDTSLPGLPTSSKNVSNPAGITNVRNLAGLVQAFI